jgi:hypothetical protein
MRCEKNRNRSKREWKKKFDHVVEQFKKGALLKEINESGHCEYVFSELVARKCERAKGHEGAHMFGIDKSLMRRE